MTQPRQSNTLRITHGRHCTCSACAREDWTNPELAPCGMHGPACARQYAPLGAAGQLIVVIDDPAGRAVLADTRPVWLLWDAMVMAKARMPKAPAKGDTIVFELEPTLWNMRESDIETHCELVRRRHGVFPHSTRFAIVVR